MPVRPLTAELCELVEKTRPGALKRFSEDLDYLRAWIKQQPHLRARTDDQWLAAFLRCCKYSIERTKQKIDNYYTIRSLLPEFFVDRDPLRPEIQSILEDGGLAPLPNPLGASGPRIILINFKKSHGHEHSFIDLTKVLFMVLDVLMLEDDNYNVSGTIFLAEIDSITFPYMIQLTPTYINKFFTCLQEAYPGRIKQMQLTNGYTAFEVILNLIKSMVKGKMNNRIFYYGVESTKKHLKEHIPGSYLPREYGGENGSVGELGDIWKKKLESYRDWFLDDSKYGCDESLRSEGSKSSSSLFGVEGTFRKLAVD